MTLVLISPAFASTWEMERPSYTIEGIDERVENTNVNGEAAVGIGVDIYTYRENASDSPFSGRDSITLRVVGTANTRKGIDYTSEWHESLRLPYGPIFEHTLSLGDDEGVWLNFPYSGLIAFYSGPGLQNNSRLKNLHFHH
jgi:hypothetical protein